MGWVLGVAVVLVTLSPASIAVAQTDPTYQTANGVETLPSMAGQLMKAGYDGPWDPQSVVDAYARTTGGEVTAINGDAPAGSPPTAVQPQPPSGSGVVLVAGALSYWGGMPFGALVQILKATKGDIWYFSYQGFTLDGTGLTPKSYNATDTCQDLSVSEERLRDYLIAIRSGSTYSVSLVGHSLGGVIALETVLRYPELQPMVKSIVTVDSPLLGISAFKEEQWLGWFGLAHCTAMDSLVPRNQAKAATLTRLQAGAQQLLNRGLWVTTIINDGDDLFIAAHGDQGIYGVKVNVEGTWLDSGANHNAVLNTADGIQTILQAIP